MNVLAETSDTGATASAPANANAAAPANPELDRFLGTNFTFGGSRFDLTYRPTGGTPKDQRPISGDVTVTLRLHVTFKNFDRTLRRQPPYNTHRFTRAQLADFKKRRDPKAVAQALDNIRAACQGKSYSSVSPQLSAFSFSSLHPTNVMPALVDGALANCTLGEMVQAMADIYGRYTGGPEW